MAEYIKSLERLAEQFAGLEGVGKKTAVRMAYSVVSLTDEEAEEFANAILDAKRSIHLCPVCQNLTDKDICPICADEVRDHGLICVVEDTKAVMSIEKVREYRGVYHVLHGVISPSHGVTPDKIKLRELLDRVKSGKVNEVVVATNPNVEGEATAMYISRILKPLGVRVTRLAYGVPVGADLEYADEVTLFRALEGRKDV